MAAFIGARGWSMEGLSNQRPRTVNQELISFMIESFNCDKARGHVAAALLFFQSQYWWVRSYSKLFGHI